ncbi:MAG: ABC transporter permease subunit [Verrucomicrobiota bacterium]
MKLLGWFLMVVAVAGAMGEWFGLRLPTVSAPFEWGEDLSLLFPGADWLVSGSRWIGFAFVGLLWVIGAWLVASFSGATKFTPMTLRRMARFRSIGRGYWSLVILVVLAGVACLDFLIVGNEALAVKYEGRWYFPAFEKESEGEREEGERARKPYAGGDFGVEGDLAQAPPDWRERKLAFRRAQEGDWVLMPLIPFAPTGDDIGATSVVLKEKEGVLRRGGRAYRGLAAKVYDAELPEKRYLQVAVREGVPHGAATGWDEDNNQVFSGRYERGTLVPDSAAWSGEGTVEDFLGKEMGPWRKVWFRPSAPVVLDSPKHVLGTTSQGYDVLAYLYGGLQVNFLAVVLYIPLVYAIGVTVGLLMGYFGGWFDLVVQRLIEIFSNIPFLYVVMIASASVPMLWKDKFGLGLIITILVVFGWMGMTYLMRTSALKEKARDYVAASRVIGASTPQILFKHLLPNSVAILVTLVPFSISSLVLSLTALDYLGFGLPERYASWGKLLRDGLENLTAPWLVSSAFVVLVALLVLVTFVGEAVREAFDPKKYTFYR